MNTSYQAKLVVCPPVDPSGKVPATPFEVDIANAFASLLIIPAFPLSGSGTTSLPLGALPAAGAKLFAIMLDPTGSPAAISVAWTYQDSTTGGVKELTAIGGAPGLAAVCNPNPTNGIAAVSVTHTTGATIRYVAIG